MKRIRVIMELVVQARRVNKEGEGIMTLGVFLSSMTKLIDDS